MLHIKGISLFLFLFFSGRLPVQLTRVTWCEPGLSDHNKMLAALTSEGGAGLVRAGPIRCSTFYHHSTSRDRVGDECRRCCTFLTNETFERRGEIWTWGVVRGHVHCRRLERNGWNLAKGRRCVAALWLFWENEMMDNNVAAKLVRQPTQRPHSCAVPATSRVARIVFCGGGSEVPGEVPGTLCDLGTIVLGCFFCFCKARKFLHPRSLAELLPQFGTTLVRTVRCGDEVGFGCGLRDKARR